MSAADDPIEWKFTVPEGTADGAWVVATWRLPHLEGVRSEALAQWLTMDDIYRLHMYRPWSRRIRRHVCNWARRHPRWSWKSLREKPIYGKWNRRTPAAPLDIQGAIGPPPRGRDG